MQIADVRCIHSTAFAGIVWALSWAVRLRLSIIIRKKIKQVPRASNWPAVNR